MKKYNIVNNSLGWLCFVIAAATYLLTLEPTASFWDCPEFISQGAKLEVGHPPGNPIFMLTARFFVTVFGNNIQHAAVAVNSMSALLSAATILLLFWTITHLVRKIMVKDGDEEISWRRMAVIMGAGLCGALAYTWSDTFWFSAVEGEVYAFSSFCTALVFWLILKWENRADEAHSDRYLVLIAYVIGVSIAVHLLNLLCIPAIVLVFYYRKWQQPDAKGSLIALGVSVVLVAAILYGLVPGYIKVAQLFELLFVNGFGMGFNSGVLAYAIVLVGVFAWAIWLLYQGKRPGLIRLAVFLSALLSGITFISNSHLAWLLLTAALAVYLFAFCRRIPLRVFNVAILSIFFIFVGYSSYALLLIRASANTPMNQNAPDNVFTLASYLNREQYGQRPLFYGPVWAEAPATVSDNGVDYMYLDGDKLATDPLQNGDAIYYNSDGTVKRSETKTHRKAVKTSPSDPDRYEETVGSVEYSYSPQLCVPFTRIYSYDHVDGYKGWSLYSDIDTAMLRKKMPPHLYRQLVDEGYLPAYMMINYVPGIKRVSRVQGNPDYDMYVIKPSFADNLRYFFNYQLNHMYWRYFMWNFAGRQNDIQGNGEPNLGNWISGIPFIDNARLGDQSLLPDYYGKGNKGHNVFYMLPLLMGLIGLIWQSLCRHRRNPQRGIEQFWVVFFLFFMTGVAIVLYLNQTPGQPRERDYAFAGSFYAFAIWLGMGVPAISRFVIWIAKLAKGKGKDGQDARPSEGVKWAAACAACAVGLLVPLQMVSQTWDDHDRSHRYTTRDFGANYLYSLDDNAIIFTNGDNDTFPLWYAQEVEGIRTDVRVVNLSYLSTDWYANQMKHPYYDADAVPMLAEPIHYSSDKYQYSQLDADDFEYVPALEGLRRFYDEGEGILRTPNMYAPVDSAAAMARFGITSEPFDTIWQPTDITMHSLGLGSFFLNKLLSFDIVANSVAGNFERPVYFASTVPSSYYLGLVPYMYSTGVAQQVAPFKDAPVSPLADKGYENIMSKFRWGGLDDPKHNKGLYLDETVRRMVSTMRSSITDIAEQLMRQGERPASEFAIQWAKDHGQPVPANHYDMARALLHLSEEKLPLEAMAYENMSDLTLATLYYNLYDQTGNADDLARADVLLDVAFKRYSALAKYVNSLPYGLQQALSVQDLYSLQQLPMMVALKNYRDVAQQAAGREELEPYIDTLRQALLYSANAMLFVHMYTSSMQPETFMAYADQYGSSPRAEELRQAAALIQLYRALGRDREKEVEQTLAPYGLNYREFLSAVR